MKPMSKERLEDIAREDSTRLITVVEAVTMARELLALRKAREAAVPVAYIFKHPAGKLFWGLTDESNKDQRDVMPVYAAPPAQPVTVPTFEEWCERTEQKPVGWVREAMMEAYEGCRNAMHHGSPENDPDTVAMAVAEGVLALVKQPHIGGDCQLLAKIQCLILDEMGLRRG